MIIQSRIVVCSGSSLRVFGGEQIDTGDDEAMATAGSLPAPSLPSRFYYFGLRTNVRALGCQGFFCLFVGHETRAANKQTAVCTAQLTILTEHGSGCGTPPVLLYSHTSPSCAFFERYCVLVPSHIECRNVNTFYIYIIHILINLRRDRGNSL